MKPILSISGLDVTIGATRVCRGLELDVAAQSCWAVLGPNGAGKTTLLHTLAGLLPSHSGKIRLQQQDIHRMPPTRRARDIGLMLQMEETGFPANLLEWVMSGRHPHLDHWGWETDRDLQITHDAIHLMGLSELEQRPISTLSGGERRRMDMATLLAQQPMLALLDEPSNHLDPGQQIRCINLLTRHFQQPEHALIMALHDVNLATRYCDHLLLLQGEGRWLAGPVDEIATEQNISELYGHEMHSLPGPQGRIFVAK